MAHEEFAPRGEIYLSDDDTRGESYSLGTAEEGDVVRVITDQGVHELVKASTYETVIAGDGTTVEQERKARDGWTHGGEPVSVTLLEPNKYGSAFLLHRETIHEGDELGVNYVDRPVREAAIIHNLGQVAGFAELLEQKKVEARASA